MLRQELTACIGLVPETREVVVREITPLQAEKLHRVLLEGLEKNAQGITARELADLMVGDAGLKLELLQQCSDLGQEIHDLGALAFMQLWEAFEEVNAPFLERLAGMLQSGAAMVQADASRKAGEQDANEVNA